LKDTTKPGRARAQAPRILARIQDPRSVEVLTEQLLDDDTEVRSTTIQALATLMNRMPGTRIDNDAIGAALRRESKAYFELLALQTDLDAGDATPLLSDAIRHRETQVRARLFGLLGLKYPAETIDLVSRNLASSQANTRANAVEVLDNLLSNEEKPYVIPLVEDTPPDRKLKVGADLVGITRTHRTVRLKELLAGKDEWLQVVAAMAIATWKLTELEPEVRALLFSENPVGRESAICALKLLGSASFLRTEGPNLVQDPAPFVSRYARFVLQSMEA
jgi:hypothetical protein